MAIKKIFTNLNIDRIEGDCIEFGILLDLVLNMLSGQKTK